MLEPIAALSMADSACDDSCCDGNYCDDSCCDDLALIIDFRLPLLLI